MKLFDTSHLIRWLRTHNILPRYTSSREPFHGIKTEFSATVFTGDVQQWVDYLQTPRDERYDNDILLSILWSKRNRILTFRAENRASQNLSDLLNDAFTILSRRVEAISHVADAYTQAVFENESNAWTNLYLRVSSILPSEGSREIVLDDALTATTTDIVLQSAMVDKVTRAYEQVRRSESADRRLGYAWPMARRVFSQLGYRSNPRDRFVEKIDLVYRNSLLAVNLLYKDKSMGRLVPNQLGKIYQRYVAQKSNIAEQDLFEEHPYFRLLNELSFLRDKRCYREYEDVAKVLVREYLDGRYLRLSLGGVMPDVTEPMAPMPFVRKKKSVRTPLPKTGRYGILDDDDLQAWKKVESAFREMGFAVLRQLGMGEFGRVYEALNFSNPSMPRRVAIKVDRIRSGMKKQAILGAETTLQISRDLARSPHVIRIYDAGKLHKKKFTYHVLQLIDGDTLDNLIGVAGYEHATVHRPTSPRSEEAAKKEYARALTGSKGEGWRRQIALPFTDPLTLSQLLDLMTRCEISEEFKDKVGNDKQPQWPVGTGAKGNQGIAQQLQSETGKNSIGYIEYGFAAENDIKMALLENRAGEFIKPSNESAQSTLSNAQFDDNLIAWMPDPEGKGDYPIVTFTWMLFYKKYDDEKKAETLRDLVNYCVDEGQQISTELGYIPLPDDVREKVKTAAKKIGA